MDAPTCIGCGTIGISSSQCPRHNTRLLHEIASKIMDENRRALEVLLPATLTLDQWLIALEYFSVPNKDGLYCWSCVYCRRNLNGQFTVEHWLPISLGGGTTANNCVPSCSTCNMLKGVLTGEEFLTMLNEVYGVPYTSERVEKVQEYFDLVLRGEDILRSLPA